MILEAVWGLSLVMVVTAKALDDTPDLTNSRYKQ